MKVVYDLYSKCIKKSLKSKWRIDNVRFITDEKLSGIWEENKLKRRRLEADG